MLFLVSLSFEEELLNILCECNHNTRNIFCNVVIGLWTCLNTRICMYMYMYVRICAYFCMYMRVYIRMIESIEFICVCVPMGVCMQRGEYHDYH